MLILFADSAEDLEREAHEESDRERLAPEEKDEEAVEAKIA